MVGIIFGSSMGNTEDAAKAISAQLGIENEVVNVADIAPSELGKYSSLIVGSSTWNDGELQDDWASFDFSALEVTGKTVAIFGMGDSASYSDAYCNAMAELYEQFTSKGAKIVGAVSTEGYEFDASNAVKDGKFVGLALDNDNQSDLTDSRISAWVEQIKPNLA
ncbi:flavodoxin FldA [Campylobacter sp. VBCF_05 NA6]|uniref:flavodoxin FldA n=1 Tax=unclassified Campylobacter TaxID=2593542 RepID=UPI0022E9D8F9|nr:MULTISPECIES: flavodoxin FldA [unclassified Campylobacter]MDA3058278.1 flavodoxin FldA [Campylobacter sp. VBCF_04 NA7]MDA3059848.1 flavodoxin FldA [Campylobacter sp. VBCF_05 NA6]MDA3062310.1 flavodoxin FldA [Campylobacter sp. JMF_14 EL1]MDA3073571.1 flavodoxin FldA [Campylobacter sp. JMF_10 EL2]